MPKKRSKWLAAGRLDEAVSAYRKAAGLTPHDLRPLINWARTLLDQGDAYAAPGETERARAVYRRAGEVPPVRIWAVTGEAELLANIGGLDEAVQLCVTLIAEDPSVEQGYLELNSILASHGETADCVAQFAALAAKHFESAMAHFYYAMALSTAQDWAGAIAEYRKAAEIAPQNARIEDSLKRANEQLTGAAAPLSSQAP